MNIDIFCDSKNHPILPFLNKWIKTTNNSTKNYSQLLTQKDELNGGDILFLISCNQLINYNIRNLYQNTLVIHESDLPEGKGWSPLTWQILEGKNNIVISLFKAEDSVDSGEIYKQELLKLNGTEVYNEINNKLFKIKGKLMKWAIDNVNQLKAKKTNNINSSYYRKRTASDSEININDSIQNQFNLLRVCDPDRYPAFFYYKKEKYIIKITKQK